MKHYHLGACLRLTYSTIAVFAAAVSNALEVNHSPEQLDLAWLKSTHEISGIMSALTSGDGACTAPV